MTQVEANPQTVDVVVVAHNGGSELRDAVSSILDSSGVSVRVVVVDNASTDGCTGQLSHELVELVRLPKNIGYGAGFNAALTRVRAPWVVCANQDVRLNRDSLRFLLETIQSETARGSGPVICGPRITRGDDKPVETCHELPTLRKQLQALLLGERFGTRNTIVPTDIPDAPVECGWVSGVFLLAGAEVFRRLGGYDPNYFMYVEDLDLFRRLNEIGGRCIWEPRSVVLHNGGVGPERPISSEMYCLTLRNVARYFRKHARFMPTAQEVLVLGAGVVGSLARACMWFLRSMTAVAPRWRRDNGDRGNSAPNRNQALAMARMFGGAAWLVCRSIALRRPCGPPATPATQPMKRRCLRS